MELSISITTTNNSLKVSLQCKLTRKTFHKVIIDKKTNEIKIKDSFFDENNRFSPISDDDSDSEGEVLDVPEKSYLDIMKHIDYIEGLEEAGLCYHKGFTIISNEAEAENLKYFEEDDDWFIQERVVGFINLTCRRDFKHKRTLKSLAKQYPKKKIKELINPWSFEIIIPHEVVKEERRSEYHIPGLSDIHFEGNYGDYLKRMSEIEAIEEIKREEKRRKRLEEEEGIRMRQEMEKHLRAGRGRGRGRGRGT
jgi:hypothetical protein